jgi:hypothetical protein
MAGKRKSNRIFNGWTAAIWIVVLSVFMGELLFYTWCRVQFVQTGYAIANEARKHQELQVLQNSLKIELARLKTPENISRVIHRQMDLVMPNSQQIIVVPQP